MTETVLDITSAHHPQEQKLAVTLSGALIRQTAHQAWLDLMSLTSSHQGSDLEINLAHISECDATGLVTLLEFQKTPNQCTLLEFPNQFSHLFNMLKEQANSKPPIELSDNKLSFLEKIGKQVTTKLATIKTNMTYFGEILYTFFLLCRHPGTLRPQKLFYYIEDMGPKSLPLVVLIGLLFGVILSFQSAIQLKMFGAEIYVASLVSLSLIRELGPLLVAIVMMGRSASAYAAEISAMNVNQEVDALKTMALDPIPYLILPRLLAAGIVAPLLTLIMVCSGMLGCLLLMKGEGFTTSVILQQMFSYLTPGDLAAGMIKSIFFGVMVVGIGCMNGLNSQRDTMAVGRSTTNTVVKCIVMITVLDGLFATLFYYLGL
jgi:phospholipid/cholesterol/gamma-HCH transport system permease protein